MPRLMRPAAERFWEKVAVAGPGECWEWTAAIQQPFGYGVFHPVKGQTVRAHRYSLSLHLGRPVGANKFACHTCDNPPCVNPAHLYEGTSQNNVDDAVSRNRHKAGEKDPSAKLSDFDVLMIRELSASGTKNRALAEGYGVAESLISGVVRGTRWAHVGGPRTNKYNMKKKAVPAHGK